MIVVIQCAASKRPDAGHLRAASGTPVSFVAKPHLAPAAANQAYARPDDLSDTGPSWRELLLAYNKQPNVNPLRLLPAYQRYENRTYGRIVDQFGVSNVYILSAGWGLIRADFWTPYYDITYSQSAEDYKRRRKSDQYSDFRMIPAQTDEEVVFFGGKDYVPLFASLTAAIRARKTVFYNASQAPQAAGCKVQRFVTSTRTNWHYECANALIEELCCPLL